MEKISERNCPICQSELVDILHPVKFAVLDGYPLPDHYDLVCCVRCGFVFADTFTHQAMVDLFYRQYSMYEDYQTATGSGYQDWDLHRLVSTAQRISEYLQDPKASILDLGCARGGLLQELRNLGYENIVGMDPSPACIRHITDDRKIAGFIGSIFQVPEDIGEFDCVILSHVLEHLYDLHGAVQNVTRLVKQDGWIYIEVPDATHYSEYVFSPYQDINTEHINHFSPASLWNLLNGFGFHGVTAVQTTIHSSPDTQYPVICWLGQKSTPCVSAAGLTKDADLRPQMERYLRRSADLLDAMDHQINLALAGNLGVIVWGVGQLSMKLLAATSLANADIRAFVDGNTIHQGMTMRGRPVLAPEQIGGYQEPILIATTLHQETIVHTIRHTLGMANQIITLR